MPPSGFYEPPPTDRDLDAEIVRHVLRAQFPDLALRSVEHLGDGWEHDAYLVDDHLVFRFPRYADTGRGLARDAQLFALVDSATEGAVRVPRIRRWGAPSARFPHPFAGHEVIPGVAATDPRVPETPALADDIGRALTLVHAIPESAAVEIYAVRCVAEASCREPLDLLLQQLPHVPELRDLAPEVGAWLDAGPAVPRDWDGAPRFIHNDFHPDHVIVSPTTGRLSGIIDWSGAALGDPALDFGYLPIVRGASFLRRAVAAYGLPVDAALVERALFRARVRAVGWLADAVKRRGDAAPCLEIVRRVFATE
jgi:aminoglycoside phosphotransferase (APT) family kinase protein